MKFSGKQLDRYGQALLDPFTRGEVIEKVTEWRMTHLPVLREFVEKFAQYLAENKVSYAFYSQRVKRMTSIIDKLRNNPEMGLGRLQDIGGARFVFDTIDDLKKCQEIIENFVPENFTFIRTTDYISNPKTSGYRSVHYIYQYHSSDETYNNLRIELQIRTRLEHSWAMAVETASLISRTSLKANIEDGSIWRNFFKLVSAIFAIKENCPAPAEYKDYNHERYCIEYINYIERYRLLDQLSALRVTVNHNELNETAQNGYCVLSIDFIHKTVSFRAYGAEEEDTAKNIFAQLEQNIDSNEAVLLVSIAKMQELREAYPSYFLDTEGFLQALSDFNNSCAIYRKES